MLQTSQPDEQYTEQWKLEGAKIRSSLLRFWSALTQSYKCLKCAKVHENVNLNPSKLLMPFALYVLSLPRGNWNSWNWKHWKRGTIKYRILAMYYKTPLYLFLRLLGAFSRPRTWFFLASFDLLVRFLIKRVLYSRASNNSENTVFT